MRTGISITITRSVRGRLEAITRDRNASQKHAWRAAIILSSADGVGTNEIMRRTGKSKTCVWRWQERFMKEGIDGLLHDKTRPSRIPPLGPEVAARVVALTLADPPVETTHWTADLMARASGISASAVRRIWKAHGLQPHRYRQFKLSNDPNFVDKLRDVVGLYVDPPAHAIVLSLDEKSQIQALDRTQPGLPLKKGRLGTMTHDYKRHGTTTLFAALNVLDGTVIGRNMQRHRHQEFMRFLNAIEAEVPAGKMVHVILDNYAAHKHPKVRAWLDRHERFVFHFTPTSCSWLNAVEGFFARLSRRRLKRGVFRSVVDLQAAINRFLAETNAEPKPFTWTADPDKIIAAVRRGHQAFTDPSTSLLARALKGQPPDLTPDDVQVFVQLESMRLDLVNGIDPSEHDRPFLIALIDQFVVPASRRGRHSPKGPKQYVAYLADITKRDYREHYRRERVSRAIEYRIYKRAIELVEGRFPQWRGRVILDPGVPGETDIRRYNWQPSEAMEIEGEAKFPNARKLMRRAWNSQPGAWVLR